ncbi:MAG: UdgX family uracil-DNA binding protein [Pseudomonadota bacterium]
MPYSSEPAAAGAEAFLPGRRTLDALREAVHGCRGCPLYANATRAVFGSGSATARMVLVGEQPGHEEDLRGAPFVGPAGRVLDEALAAAGIARADAYVTNAVKHFKWQPRGKRRLHSKPAYREVSACRPWLEAELAALRPQVLVCLGATAGQSLFGPGFRISRQRGAQPGGRWAPHIVASVHPSAVLRQPTHAGRIELLATLVEDLRAAAALLRGDGEDDVAGA